MKGILLMSEAANSGSAKAMIQIGLLYSERTSGRFITTDVKAIENLKDEMARDKTDAFMNDMCKIGLYKEDVIEIIKNYQNTKSKANDFGSLIAYPFFHKVKQGLIYQFKNYVCSATVSKCRNKSCVGCHAKGK